MTKAKKGDRILIVDGDSITKEYKGQYATVELVYSQPEKSSEGDYTLEARLDSSVFEPIGEAWSWREKDYELVTIKPPNTLPDFQKGDRVVVIEHGSAPSYTSGKSGVVVGPSVSGSGAFKVRIDGETETWYFKPEYLRLESAQTTTEPPTDLDPRVLAYMHAKTLEPDALIDDRIQLAEWLMKK